MTDSPTSAAGWCPSIAPGYYLGPDNGIRISSWNSATGVRLTIAGQMLTPDGHVRDFSHDHVPNTNRTVNTSNLRFGEGWILSAHVFASSGTPLRGQCFIRLQVLQGFTGAQLVIGTILSGYVTANVAIGWPGSPLASPLDGAGFVRYVTGTNPGAGNEIFETVPANVRWRLDAFVYTFTASAAAANRVGTLIIGGVGGLAIERTGSAIAVTAGQSAIYIAGARPFFTIDTRVYQLPLVPSFLLNAGDTIQTTTALIDVGDTYTTIRYHVEEWFDV